MEKRDKKIVFLRGKKTILRPLNKETDLNLCLQWVNDQDVIQYLSLYLPASIQDEAEWFDNLIKRKQDIILGIEIPDKGLIGTTGLHKIDWKDRTAEHGVIIGAKDCWSKGYGKDAHMTLLNYAFNTLNLRKINSSFISFNIRSRNYHLTCGYKIEGRRRKQVYRNGKYWDMVIVGLFKREWITAWKKYQEKE